MPSSSSGGASERTRLVIFVMLFFGVAAFGAVVMHQAAKTRSEDAHPENTPLGQKEKEPSTDIDKRTPLTSKEIKGKGVGEVVSYYYTFNAGPGEVRITVDGKNQPNPGEAPHANVAGFTDAIAVEISDLDAKSLLRINLGYTQLGKREVERFQLRRRQQVILCILLSQDTLDYTVRLEGQIDFSPAPKAQGPQ